MILIIKSTLSLSILTDRSSGWWATPNSSPFSHIIRMIRTQFIHSHDNEYNRFKREGFMMLNTLLILQINSLNHYSQHSEVISIPHPSLFHLSHSSISYSLSCYQGQVAIRFNPYESLSYQHSSLLSSLWLWDITILFHYPLINPYSWILSSVW